MKSSLATASWWTRSPSGISSGFVDTSGLSSTSRSCGAALCGSGIADGTGGADIFGSGVGGKSEPSSGTSFARCHASMPSFQRYVRGPISPVPARPDSSVRVMGPDCLPCSMANQIGESAGTATAGAGGRATTACSGPSARDASTAFSSAALSMATVFSLSLSCLGAGAVLAAAGAAATWAATAGPAAAGLAGAAGAALAAAAGAGFVEGEPAACGPCAAGTCATGLVASGRLARAGSEMVIFAPHRLQRTMRRLPRTFSSAI